MSVAALMTQKYPNGCTVAVGSLARSEEDYLPLQDLALGGALPTSQHVKTVLMCAGDCHQGSWLWRA